MIHDKDYRTSIVNTVYYTGGSVPLGMLVGLALALLLNQPIRFRGPVPDAVLPARGHPVGRRVHPLEVALQR